MNFNPEEIYQITATIWETAIGLRIEPGSSGSIGNRPRSTAACIQITGAWNGAILLDCPAEVGRLAASIMFSSDPANVTIADLQDAVAELVNMIGGNFKALLPETCFLSLPAVVEGGDYSARVPGSTLLGRVTFTCEGHAMSITVLEKRNQQVVAA
jgi:CheY-specific phosphatase CheX